MNRDRIIMATTLETSYQGILDSIGCKTSPLTERVRAIAEFKSLGFKTRISLEPLYSFDPTSLAGMIEACGPELVEIGLDNYMNYHGLQIPQPTPSRVNRLLRDIKAMDIQVNLKKGMPKFLNGEVKS